MRIGANTMVFWNRPLLEAIERLGDTGVDTAEIWAEHAWRSDGNGAPPDDGQVRRALERAGLTPTVHCPVMDVNTTSPNPGIGRESERQMLAGIRFAADIGADVFVLHPGRFFSLQEDTERHWQRQQEVLEGLVREGERRGVRVALENMEYLHELHSIREADHMVRALNGFPPAWLGVTLDLAHLGDTERCLSFVGQLAGRIIHLHVSDALADGAPHHPLGTGVLDMEAILAELRDRGFQGCHCLEVFLSGDAEGVGREAAKLRAVLGTGEAGRGS